MGKQRGFVHVLTEFSKINVRLGQSGAIIEHMRPFGTTQQLARRRQRAIVLLQRGQNPSQVAKRLGTTARSVRRWRQQLQHGKGKPQTRTPGCPCRLSAVQRLHLIRVLERGASAYGYAEDYWTLERIAHLIWDLFRIRYRSSGVWYLLRRLGWSCQKPQRRALHRNEKAIAHWKRYQWPQIKRKWRALRATLIFLDASGFSMVSPLKRTWAPRGQTPIIRTSIEHKERVNLMGALCVSPKKRKIKLHLHSYRTSLNGEHVIRFLKRLLRCVRGPIVMVWDRHPIHRRGEVQTFLARHPRLHVYEFPTAAPELHPIECVWTQISEHIANTAPHNHTELRANVLAASARIRRSQRRLWTCIFASDLPWER